MFNMYKLTFVTLFVLTFFTFGLDGRPRRFRINYPFGGDFHAVEELKRSSTIDPRIITADGKSTKIDLDEVIEILTKQKPLNGTLEVIERKTKIIKTTIVPIDSVKPRPSSDVSFTWEENFKSS